jgi:hypothetical protein
VCLPEQVGRAVAVGVPDPVAAAPLQFGAHRLLLVRPFQCNPAGIL